MSASRTREAARPYRAVETSLTLADYTSPELLIPYLRGRDAAAVIQELSAALHRQDLVSDLLQFYQAALNREYLCSTATESGWALPHTVVRFLQRPYFALGRSATPMQWVGQGCGINSALRVQTVFLVAVPETDARSYLTLIAGLARLSKDSRLLGTFLSARDSFELFEVLKQVKVRRE